MKKLETLLKDYKDHEAERAAKGIPPLPLNAELTNYITKLLEDSNETEIQYLLELLKLVGKEKYQLTWVKPL